MKLILGLAVLLGALSVNAQDRSQSPQPTSEAKPLTPAQAVVNIELDEAARAYRAGHFAEARQHAEAAQTIDPLSKTAPLFIARIIHRQYSPGVRSPENLAVAFEAIEAYRRILASDQQNEEAYKAVASLYGAIKEDELQTQWILEHAVDFTIAPDNRAAAYVVLASKAWHCAYELTDLPTNKTTVIDRKNKATIIYKRPKDEADFETAQRCVASGLEQVGLAIALAPENQAAWSYKTNLLIEASKLAEMEGNLDLKAELDRRVDESRRRTDELNRKNERQREELERGLTIRP